MSGRRLTGKIHSSAIGRLELPLIPAEIIEGFRALGADLSSLVSDVLDEMGVARTIGASVLRPIYPEVAIVGRALTLRNVVQSDSPFKGATAKISRLAEIEAHNLAEPGDMLVTRDSQLGRGLPTVAGQPSAFFPLAQSFFLCETHDQLSVNAYFQNNLLQFLLAR